jgi:protein TonB
MKTFLPPDAPNGKRIPWPGCPGCQATLRGEGAGPGETRQEKALQENLQERYIKLNLGAIGKKIKENLSYPYIARRRGQEGKALVAFLVGLDGSVKQVRVMKSSGHQALDREAKRAIQAAAPFPAPGREISLTLPVTFKLE